MNKKTKYTIQNTKYLLTIGWLYPDLMSTYGDRGNIIVLTKRCEWRGIHVKVQPITLDTKSQILNTCDLLFMGGAQDKEQEIVNQDLQKKKGDLLTKAIEDNTPGLFVCGAYQFLGKYYKTAEGTKLPGLGTFDIHTIHPGENSERLIGNIIIQPFSILNSDQTNKTKMSSPTRSGIQEIDSRLSFGNTQDMRGNDKEIVFVGFENHGGRTYLGKDVKPFGRVITGFGNNGEDGTEGMIYKNSIGTYLHGPVLPKNPELADFLLEKALEKKYGKMELLKPLPRILSEKAKNVLISKI